MVTRKIIRATLGVSSKHTVAANFTYDQCSGKSVTA